MKQIYFCAAYALLIHATITICMQNNRNTDSNPKATSHTPPKTPKSPTPPTTPQDHARMILGMHMNMNNKLLYDDADHPITSTNNNNAEPEEINPAYEKTVVKKTETE